MPIQYRPNSSGMLYAPARDLTYFFPDLCKRVAKSLHEQQFPDLHRWLDSQGVTSDDLGEACRAFCEYLVTSHEVPAECPNDVLERAGWFKVKPEAQIAYMYYVGTTMAGYFFKGIRDVQELGRDAPASLKQLRTYGKYARMVMSMPPWRRWLYLRTRSFARWCRRAGAGRTVV